VAVKRKTREKQVRSLETRERLLDGAVECLIKHGYSGTTTLTLSEISGVSRGGQQFHFPTREMLVVTAVEHLTARVIELIRTGALKISRNEDPVSAIVNLLWNGFSGRWFIAAYELWIAARTDDALRAVFVPAEQRTGRAILKICLDFLPSEITERDDFYLNLQSMINMMHGLALTQFTKENKELEDYTLSLCEQILRGKVPVTPRPAV
jgi:AcrR family transcriptional regulator